jgi:hypothetical protein
MMENKKRRIKTNEMKGISLQPVSADLRVRKTIWKMKLEPNPSIKSHSRDTIIQLIDYLKGL